MGSRLLIQSNSCLILRSYLKTAPVTSAANGSCPQEPTTSVYSEPDESSSQPSTLFL